MERRNDGHDDDRARAAAGALRQDRSAQSRTARRRQRHDETRAPSRSAAARGKPRVGAAADASRQPHPPRAAHARRPRTAGARSSSPTIKAAAARLDAARERRRQAGAWSNPAIGFTGDELDSRGGSAPRGEHGVLRRADHSARREAATIAGPSSRSRSQEAEAAPICSGAHPSSVRRRLLRRAHCPNSASRCRIGSPRSSPKPSA